MIYIPSEIKSQYKKNLPAGCSYYEVVSGRVYIKDTNSLQEYIATKLSNYKVKEDKILVVGSPVVIIIMINIIMQSGYKLSEITFCYLDIPTQTICDFKMQEKQMSNSKGG